MLARRLHALACRSMLHPSALHALASNLHESTHHKIHPPATQCMSHAWPPLHNLRHYASPPSPPKEMSERDILRRLAGFMLHDSGAELKMRLATAMGLLVASKAINVQVPFLFKYAVDALSTDPTGATPTILWGLALTPPAMVVAYGGARAAATFCNELRNAVFAKVCTQGAMMSNGSRVIALFVWCGHTARMMDMQPTGASPQVTQETMRRVANHVFSHLLALDMTFHLSRQTGALSRAIDRGTRGMYRGAMDTCIAGCT